MPYKRIVKALLCPPVAVLLALTPIGASLLVFALVRLSAAAPVSILSYLLSAYLLAAWCARAPRVLSAIRAFRESNRLWLRWRSDERLRVRVSLQASLVWNLLYGVFQLWLGIFHRTLWFTSLGAYYFCLAAMRGGLFRYTKRHAPGEGRRSELVLYRRCGKSFLLMNLALALIVFYMVFWGRTFRHHEITTIAMAAFTFTSLSLAIVDMVRYRKYDSPVFSASKAIGFAAACVSMLTLTSTMLTTFGEATDPRLPRILLGAVGAAVSLVVLAMAAYMILQSGKRLAEPNEKQNENLPQGAKIGETNERYEP